MLNTGAYAGLVIDFKTEAGTCSLFCCSDSNIDTDYTSRKCISMQPKRLRSNIDVAAQQE